MSSRLIGIHPIDGNLRFLKRMSRLLDRELGKAFKYQKLRNNQKSHAKCLAIVKNAGPRDTLLFLCHGRPDGILGCNYRTGPTQLPGNYNHGLLISKDNAEIFKDRKVFCLTCDSNIIAKEAISRGARVFIGFDSIYFDRKQSSESYKWNKHVVNTTKHELRKCMFSTLLHAWENDLTYFQCAGYLKLLINKANDRLILDYRNHRGRKFYHRSAECLQLIKEGIRVWGDGDLRISE